MLKRSSGVLMHISSLPGNYGIGDFGKSAYEFIDFLEKSNQKIWQILPLGITGYGDSPYQSFSAFAGNPYFINLDEFIKLKYIAKEDLILLEEINKENTINYEKLYIERYKVLRKAYDSFKQTKDFNKLQNFKNTNSKWLPEYALFMSLKNKFNGSSWQMWPRKYRVRDKETLKLSKVILKNEIDFYIFLEYFFRKQWDSLKKYANEKNIKIIGDIPIFVSTDSADTWQRPSMFQFDKNLKPRRVAGCPPDLFSKDGQLWGNVLYNWKSIKQDNYIWWLDRIKDSFKLYDIVRIDHFRGFDSYWSIPAKDKTAKNGKWEIGPGIELFKIIKKNLGQVDIIAEDLGFLTLRVRKLLKNTNFPGMKILQFGFEGDLSNEYLPSNANKNSVIYTGTHDNETFLGWYETRDEKEKEFCRKYLSNYIKKNTEDIEKDIVFSAIEAIWKSKSRISIVPMQDLLNLGNEARMNTPSTLGNNWNWRMEKNINLEKIEKALAYITKEYKR